MVGEHASGWRSGRLTRQARQCAGGLEVAEWAIALREVERLRQHQPAGSGQGGQPFIAVSVVGGGLGQHHVEHHPLGAVGEQLLGKVGQPAARPWPWSQRGDAGLVDVDDHRAL